MLYLIVVLIYFILCHVVASKASRRGKSYALWFIISVVIDPIIPLVILSLTS